MFHGTAAKYLVALNILAGATTGAVAGQGAGALKSLNDDARKRTYVLVRDGVEVVERRSAPKTAHVALPGWVWAGEPYSCPPDIAFAPDGNILVTSNVLPMLWRIEPRTLATTVHELALEQHRDRDVGFTRLRWSPSLRAFIAMTDLGERWHVDRALSTARKVSDAPAAQPARPCDG